jgi:Na+-driven multidrug efflux pump
MDLFGYQAQSQYIGVIMSMSSACGIISSPLANLVRDTMGSYHPIFWFCVILSVVLMALYGILYGMVTKDRKKLDAIAKP